MVILTKPISKKAFFSSLDVPDRSTSAYVRKHSDACVKSNQKEITRLSGRLTKLDVGLTQNLTSLNKDINDIKDMQKRILSSNRTETLLSKYYYYSKTRSESTNTSLSKSSSESGTISNPNSSRSSKNSTPLNKKQENKQLNVSIEEAKNPIEKKDEEKESKFQVYEIKRAPSLAFLPSVRGFSKVHLFDNLDDDDVNDDDSEYCEVTPRKNKLLSIAHLVDYKTRLRRFAKSKLPSINNFSDLTSSRESIDFTPLKRPGLGFKSQSFVISHERLTMPKLF